MASIAGGEAVDGVLAQGDGGVAEQERDAGDELRFVAQRVRAHGEGHAKHEDRI